MDSLICKRVYYHQHNFCILFEPGKKYQIKDINNIFYELGVGLVISAGNLEKYNEYREMFIDNYFITIKEERRTKLKQIENEI